MYTCDHSLFLALNFDGGPAMDRLMTSLSGTALWIPFYLLMLGLVWRRYGWRSTLLFLVCVAAAVVWADWICGIFKQTGPLEGLGSNIPPRWRPMFTPELEGLALSPDSLYALRRAGLPTPENVVHVPPGAVAGRYGTVSAHAATVVAIVTMGAAAIRRHWFTALSVVVALTVCYSRIYLAKHFPLDLLWGSLLGLLTAAAMELLWRRLRQRFHLQ